MHANIAYNNWDDEFKWVARASQLVSVVAGSIVNEFMWPT